MMNVATARNLLANLRTDEGRCEASDYAVNVLRDQFGADLAAVWAGEQARLAGAADLVAYLRARREGSPFRLNRGQRCALFVAYAARQAYRNR